MRRFVSFTLAVSLLLGLLSLPASASRWNRSQPADVVTALVERSSTPNEFDRNGRDFDFLVTAALAVGVPQAGLTVAEFLTGADEVTLWAPNDRAFVRNARDLGYESWDEAAVPAFLLGALGNDGVFSVLAYHVTPEEFTGFEVLRNRTFDEIDSRRGNVNARETRAHDVLSVNGSTGTGPRRVVRVAKDGPFELRIAAPPSSSTRERSARYVVYVWDGIPGDGTVRRLPGRLGRAGLATPLEAPFGIQPRLVANRLGSARRFGRDRWPIPAPAAAPAVLATSLDGFPSDGTFYVQGLVTDSASLSGRLAVTNGIVVIVE